MCARVYCALYATAHYELYTFMKQVIENKALYNAFSGKPALDSTVFFNLPVFKLIRYSLKSESQNNKKN